MPIKERVLTQVLHNDRTLLSLDLNNKHLSIQDVKELASALSQNKTIRFISLYNCHLTTSTLAYLLPVLKKLPLISINLGKNMFDQNGLSAIFDTLKKIPSLKEFYFKNNPMTPTSIDYLGSFIRHHPNLESLDLSLNKLGNEGARIIAHALKYAPQLKRLFLCQNHINDEGLLHLLNALEYNRHLTHLNMQFNELSAFAAFHIASLLEHNMTLLHLDYKRPHQQANYVFDHQVQSLLSRNKDFQMLSYEIRNPTPKYGVIAKYLTRLDPKFFGSYSDIPSLLSLTLSHVLVLFSNETMSISEYFKHFENLTYDLLEAINCLGKNLLPPTFYFAFTLFEKQNELIEVPYPIWETKIHRIFKQLRDKHQAIEFLESLASSEKSINAFAQKLLSSLQQTPAPNRPLSYSQYAFSLFTRNARQRQRTHLISPPTPPSCYTPYRSLGSS